ncbi:hypothetical protein HQ305_08575 [Rhodococcus sp. BP-149]|uniref:hypothetical protein n=1 Tax=unclassified Rhodococcus (in: high G+C Gram-positive bacteria) TaxID=192944 RepID=UPI001C9B4DCB|nr:MULTISPECIES: hypothetical protein [unclassified Rhodococcus (in: high G+C Gram-positive bacteria)]MBY6686136.1 hypothetical protein [Rhodococcus sp. BP-288]MBY6693774.1 hypothetical protein [Rhodococcus sp. BP-188]MBY6699629.1 hypothetical protein [Rhodococcus sp. BP-285]MBY6704026.1 hypothetical protein [Rhodococcus sp. BP-283]MBY6710825.1 hypothetical protein [Rhodococcus sp. BP-160]
MIIAVLMVLALLVGTVLVLIAVATEEIVAHVRPSLRKSSSVRLLLGIALAVVIPTSIALPALVDNPRLWTYFLPALCAGVCPFVPWWVAAR